MAKSKRPLTEQDYPFLLSIYEGLELVAIHCKEARNAQNDWTLELHLKMASRAMRYAMEIYRDHLEKELTE